MTGDWRDYRPTIWLAMLGIAAALLLNSALYAAPFLGAAIGVGLRIVQARRRAVWAPAPRRVKDAQGRPHAGVHDRANRRGRRALLHSSRVTLMLQLSAGAGGLGKPTTSKLRVTLSRRGP
jgi:hypothetical protein